jgi:hypothetical protein
MATGALVEEVATNLEEVAEVTRTINAAAVGSFMGGTWFGMAVGGILGYRLGVRRTKVKAMEEAEAEIDEMREEFRRRDIARQGEADKVRLEEDAADYEGAVKEYGGGVVPGLVDYTNPGARLRPPVPVQPARSVDPRSAEPDASVSPEVDATVNGWNYQDEFANRRAGKPYVIHEDEFTNDNLPQHSVTTYTYYQVDGVLADEDGSRLTDVQETVGNALNRFGHGTSDPNVVFVRNDALQLQIEITRLPNESYEQRVEGLQHDKA